MAWALKGPIVAGARETTGVQSATLLTAYAAGDIIVVWSAVKSTGTSGTAAEVTVTDSKGNSYIRAAEYRSGGTLGTRAALHYSTVTNALVSGDTVSLGTTSGLSQFQGIAAVGFSKSDGSVVSLAASTGASPATAATATTGNVANLSSRPYLFLFALANKASATPPVFSGQAGEAWALAGTALTGTTGGTSASGQYLHWNYKIATATGASNITSGVLALNKAFVLAALVAKFTIAADAASYAVNGNNATLLHKYKVAADAGSYAITGTNASLVHRYSLAASAGSYAISGANATLTMTALAGFRSLQAFWAGGGAIRVFPSLAADAGSYNITGMAASLLHGRKLTAESGVYVINGGSVNLTYSGAAGADEWLIRARRRARR